MIRRLALAATLALGAFDTAGAAEWHPYRHISQAPLGFWFVAVMVIGALLLFTYWAVERPVSGREASPSRKGYHALGALVLAMTVFTLLLYVVVAGRIDALGASDDAWAWSPGETLQDPGGSDMSGEPYRGYQVYRAEGCTYCHTMYVRPQDIATGWAPGATEADVSVPQDFANYPYTLLGTQRNGPDLSIIGRQIPDMSYQIAHLQNPRQFKPNSIMPRYDYMSQDDLQDLAAYLVSLGNDPRKLKAGTLDDADTATGSGGPSVPTDTDTPAAQGKKLYSSLGCVGCHSTDGARNVGPTFQGLYGHDVALESGETVTADDGYLTRAIRDPKADIVKGYPAVMPAAYGDMSDADLDALIAFIESLSDDSGSH
ncbi:hypothetical protein SAOR_08840 [Salinisphaera orenii MK-B5]|uniref:Cytochrome c domain-containing protein n=1 Tax=Salinisphaera orenii MK-B5 TaxID=856730 RepID=A0A423PNV5_9GAMM|nr:c-type cytochrome [Salinisphaera orenii]ROO27295.1 hypothetical protein SAOR_08840 [Salinisphaera orenii MK-B5]